MKRLRVNIHELTKEKGRMKREQKLLEEELAVVPALTTIHISTNVACCQSLRSVCKGFSCYDKQSDSSGKTLSPLQDQKIYIYSEDLNSDLISMELKNNYVKNNAALTYVKPCMKKNTSAI